MPPILPNYTEMSELTGYHAGATGMGILKKNRSETELKVEAERDDIGDVAMGTGIEGLVEVGGW